MDNGASSYRRFLDGDKDALTEIIREYKDGLALFLAGYVNDIVVAEELMEDTFVRLYVRKPHFSEKSSFKTWLYAIGRNIAREYIRKNIKDRCSSLENLPELTDGIYSTEAKILHDERHVALHAALKRLKPEYYRVLWLCYFEDLTSDEIAKVMHKSRNNTFVYIHRAKKALKDEMEKEGFTDENI